VRQLLTPAGPNEAADDPGEPDRPNPYLQDLAADSLRSSNPHRSHKRRQRLFLNAVSSLGGFRTPASPCLCPPRAGGRRPKPFTIAAIRLPTQSACADAFADSVAPAIREAQAAGAKTLRQIAAALNGRGIGTARGGKWEATTVANVLRRIG
jgi:hypothetical protein